MRKFSDGKCYRAINFDLSEDLLKKYYKKNFEDAWTVIKKYLEGHGFTHRQYSGYISKNPMSDIELDAAMIKFGKALPWVGYCASRFDITEIGQSFNYLGVLKGISNMGKPLHVNVKRQQAATFTRAALKKEARRVHENAKNAPAPERKHKKNNQEH